MWPVLRRYCGRTKKAFTQYEQRGPRGGEELSELPHRSSYLLGRKQPQQTALPDRALQAATVLLPVVGAEARRAVTEAELKLPARQLRCITCTVIRISARGYLSVWPACSRTWHVVM